MKPELGKTEARVRRERYVKAFRSSRHGRQRLNQTQSRPAPECGRR
jgi:hypothetical protein